LNASTPLDGPQGSPCGLDVPPDAVQPYLDAVDLVLMMGTPLGIKGVDLHPSAPERITAVRRLIHDAGRDGHVRIEADGGLRRHTVPALRAAGVDLISPGSLVFGAPDLDEVFDWLWSLSPEPA
jgi:ribulose-phosphate 3-epimerase